MVSERLLDAVIEAMGGMEGAQATIRESLRNREKEINRSLALEEGLLSGPDALRRLAIYIAKRMLRVFTEEEAIQAMRDLAEQRETALTRRFNKNRLMKSFYRIGLGWIKDEEHRLEP